VSAALTNSQLTNQDCGGVTGRLHQLLCRVLRSQFWEGFMCLNISLYCVGMGVADIDVEWNNVR
jgi:hypothetical protein